MLDIKNRTGLSYYAYNRQPPASQNADAIECFVVMFNTLTATSARLALWEVLSGRHLS
jgi:hypothetical protein